jgi:LPXTG-motif cell wall-anchored protein
MHRNRAILIGLIFLTAILSWSCAPGPNAMEKTSDASGEPAGFLKGLWHGLISPVTFIISLFSKDVRLYEIHNNGGWYNFGFVLGAGLFLGGGIFGRKRRRKN